MVWVNCSLCGQPVKKYPSELWEYNFCSNKCRVKWLSNSPNRRAKVAEANTRRRKKRIQRLCEWCGKTFYILSSSIGREDKKHANVGRFCSRECRDRWHSSYMKAHPETHSQIRTAEALMKLSKTQTGKRYSDETKKKMGRSGALNSFYGRYHTSKTRELLSRLNRERMQDPEYRQRVAEAVFKANKKKPNKAELKLQSILDRYFPKEWQYTGDGLHIIGGFAPDFTNRNGRKTLIELYGNYWHTREGISWKYTELGRIMSYNSLGFKCLVIWEHELKDEQAVVAKVKQFMKARRKR